MTADDGGEDEDDEGMKAEGHEAGVPDSDPRHLDPAGDLADAVEAAEFDVALEEGTDVEELRAFVRKAEAGEFDLRAAPGLEATVRIARALLDRADGE